MKNLLILLLFAFAVNLLPAFEVIPESAQPPPMNALFPADAWPAALKLDLQAGKSAQQQIREKTTIWLIRDRATLYLAVLLDGEDVSALMEKQDADLQKEPWRLNGIEMFFGEQAFIQIVFDYMGRVYKNFDAPLFTRVTHRKTSILIRCAIPLRLLPGMAASDRMTRANFYRKSASGVSSWQENTRGNFLDLTQTGVLLLDPPDKILASAAADCRNQVDRLVEAGGLAADTAVSLKEQIDAAGNPVPGLASGDEGLFAALKAFHSLQSRISAGQLARMKEKYGPVRPLFRKSSREPGIPGAWRPVQLAGRDYWYMFTMLGIEELEKAGLMQLPLLRDAMFLVRWGQPGVQEFLPPEGKNYRILKKYGNPFAVNTIDRLSISREEAGKAEFKAMFDREFMDKFYALWGDRFIGFLESEAFACDTGIFARTLRHFQLPEPKTREEALQTFAGLYRMSSASVPDYAPFRNLANMSQYTRDRVGNAAATQLNHLVHYCGDQISGNENGDVMGATAPKVAFARGAARQYGRPWRNYQVYYNWCYLKEPRGGMRCASKSSGPWISSVEKLLTPDCRAEAYCYLDGLKVGLGLERQKAVYLYPYLSGVGIWNSEADLEEMTSVYDMECIAGVDPLVVNLRDQHLYLSPIARIHAHFYDNIVLKRDRGVSFTPVALIWDRAHGYLPLYFGNRVWDFFNPEELEKTMWALDHHLFKRNPENSSCSTCRYGDIFDVISNEAAPDILQTYPVLYPVGDVTLDPAFVSRLCDYVRNGGVLVLNTALLKKYRGVFPSGFLGCSLLEETGSSPATYSLLDQTVIQENLPYSYDRILPAEQATILAVTTDPAQAPAILANDYGKGRVLVTTPASLKVAGSLQEMLNLFDHLMANLRNLVLDIRVDTPMQYAVNRNKTGWIVYLQNNFGVPPSGGLFPDTPPVTDTSKSADALITIPESLGRVAKVIDWWSDQEIPFQTSKRFGRGDTVLKTSLAGGDCCALEFVIK